MFGPRVSIQKRQLRLRRTPRLAEDFLVERLEARNPQLFGESLHDVLTRYAPHPPQRPRRPQPFVASFS
jgi:hypothetical protein